jgi:hypothetical protein
MNRHCSRAMMMMMNDVVQWCFARYNVYMKGMNMYIRCCQLVHCADR